jgi:hypothetical protein
MQFLLARDLVDAAGDGEKVDLGLAATPGEGAGQPEETVEAAVEGRSDLGSLALAAHAPEMDDLARHPAVGVQLGEEGVVDVLPAWIEGVRVLSPAGEGVAGLDRRDPRSQAA